MNSDITVVSAERLRAFGAHVSKASRQIDAKANEMTAELQRTLAEWGEGTDSRQAYNEFKARVDSYLRDMNSALAQMPGAIEEAASLAVATERANSDLFH